MNNCLVVYIYGLYMCGIYLTVLSPPRHDLWFKVVKYGGLLLRNSSCRLTEFLTYVTTAFAGTWGNAGRTEKHF